MSAKNGAKGFVFEAVGFFFLLGIIVLFRRSFEKEVQNLKSFCDFMILSKSIIFEYFNYS